MRLIQIVLSLLVHVHILEMIIATKQKTQVTKQVGKSIEKVILFSKY